MNERINRNITQNKIFKCTKNLKNNKTCGDDCIIDEYLKSTSNQFIKLYEKLFNLIFKSGVSGTIKLLYKNKGDKFNPKNYRPITILSCFEKLFIAVLNARLSEFSDEI